MRSVQAPEAENGTLSEAVFSFTWVALSSARSSLEERRCGFQPDKENEKYSETGKMMEQ